MEEGSKVIKRALERGITFVDIAQAYRTYPHLRAALKETGIRPVIATKSAAAGYEDMAAAIQEALRELDISYIDIFHLHAPRGEVTLFEERKGALDCLKEYKRKGIIKSVGVAGHNPALMKLASTRDDINVIFPLINKEGKGIYKGSLEEMLDAIDSAAHAGKGIYLMKALAGGTMIKEYEAALDFARSIKGVSSVAVGMVDPYEADYNVAYFEGDQEFLRNNEIKEDIKYYQVVQVVCKGCGDCIETCHSSAISMNPDGKAEIDRDACISCGYCAAACPHFAIRIV